MSSVVVLQVVLETKRVRQHKAIKTKRKISMMTARKTMGRMIVTPMNTVEVGQVVTMMRVVGVGMLLTWSFP